MNFIRLRRISAGWEDPRNRGARITLWDVDNQRQSGTAGGSSLSVGDFRLVRWNHTRRCKRRRLDINLWNVKTANRLGAADLDIGLVAGIASPMKTLVSSHTDGSIVLGFKNRTTDWSTLGGQIALEVHSSARMQYTAWSKNQQPHPGYGSRFLDTKDLSACWRNFGYDEWERFFQEEELEHLSDGPCADARQWSQYLNLTGRWSWIVPPSRSVKLDACRNGSFNSGDTAPTVIRLAFVIC